MGRHGLSKVGGAVEGFVVILLLFCVCKFFINFLMSLISFHNRNVREKDLEYSEMLKEYFLGRIFSIHFKPMLYGLVGENSRIQGRGIEGNDPVNKERWTTCVSEEDPPAPQTCSFLLHPFISDHVVKIIITAE